MPDLESTTILVKSQHGVTSACRRGEGVGGGGRGVQNPPSEIPKALQNRAKLDPIVKTVKNC